VSSSHGASAPVERLRGTVSALPAEPKVAGLVAFLVIVAVTPATHPRALAAQGGVAVVVAVLSFVEWPAVLRRLTLDVPLVVLAVTYALFGRAPYAEIVGIQISVPGATVGLAILAKSVIGIVAVSALAASTTLAETVAALRRLGVPAWFCHLLALSARQLEVLVDDFGRLRRATHVRSGSTSPAAVLAVTTRSLGPLFVRATERADRLQLAAELRGHAPDEPMLAPVVLPPRRLADWPVAFLPAFLALVALLVAVTAT